MCYLYIISEQLLQKSHVVSKVIGGTWKGLEGGNERFKSYKYRVLMYEVLK